MFILSPLARLLRINPGGLADGRRLVGARVLSRYGAHPILGVSQG
jgi:hypothetical protein